MARRKGRMSRRKVTRAETIAAVMRFVDELDDPERYGDECRYQEVVELLSCIDWGNLPSDLIRTVFRAIIEQAPIEFLRVAPYQRTLAEQAQYSAEYNGPGLGGPTPTS